MQTRFPNFGWIFLVKVNSKNKKVNKKPFCELILTKKIKPKFGNHSCIAESHVLLGK
jgi:hypothetical protein